MYITKKQCYKINPCDTVYCLYVIFISWDDIYIYIYICYIYMIYDDIWYIIESKLDKLVIWAVLLTGITYEQIK